MQDNAYNSYTIVYNYKQSKLSIMSDELINGGEEVVILEFPSGNVKVPVNTYTDVNGIVTKSTSRICPVGNTILVAEFGEVGMMEILNYSRNGAGIKASAKLVIMGISSDCPKQFKLGTGILPRMRDNHIVRHTFDPTNDFSFEKLERLASQDKDLLASVTIANMKEQSKVGLRMEPGIYNADLADRLKSNKSMGDLIYKDKKVPFINYKLMDYTNVDAIIYVNDLAE